MSEGSMRGGQRTGRFLAVGPIEIETRAYEDRRVFFDPIGSVNTVGCTYRSAEELDAMEERGEPGWWEIENSLVLSSKPPTYGGNFEFNLRGHQLSITIWWHPLYRLCTALNRVLSEREERRARLLHLGEVVSDG